MRIYISYPKQKKLDEFLSKQQKATFSYTEIACTKLEKNQPLKIPKGYVEDYNFINIGKGDQTWEKAKTTIQQWKHFPPSFTKIYPNTTKIEAGNIVVVMINILGLWCRNPAKIVYTFNKPNRFGFAYGTLQEHAEQGEEAFWISRNSNNQITYHLRAISKPKFWAAKLAYPLARKYQRKFALESMQNLKDICKV